MNPFFYTCKTNHNLWRTFFWKLCLSILAFCLLDFSLYGQEIPVVDTNPPVTTQENQTEENAIKDASSASLTNRASTGSADTQSRAEGDTENTSSQQDTASQAPSQKEGNEIKNPKEISKEEVLGPKTGIYFGIFGGAAFPMSNGISALNSPPLFSAGGKTHGDTAGVGGIQVGYNFSSYKLDSHGDYWLQPAAQFEAYYIGQENISSTLVGGVAGTTMTNIPYGFTSQLNMGIFVFDGVIRFVNPTKIVPYIGGGIGGAYLASSGTNFIAPGGINYLSGHSYSQGAFVGQGLAGVQYNFTDHWTAFIEYKILWIKETEFSYQMFNGNTMLIKYPQSFNMALGGIRYNF